MTVDKKTLSNKDGPSPSPILHEASRNYYWKGQGRLSLKTFCNGRAFYRTGYGNFAVEEGNYLLLNHGQEYSITIESENPVELFCVFFPETLVEQVYRCLLVSHEQLLDDPYDVGQRTLDFVEKTYINDKWLAPALLQLRAEYPNRKKDGIWLDELLHNLAQRLLQVHRQVTKEMLKLPSLKASTREELYKRVQIGQDYMSAYYDYPLTLASISEAACLSPNHFLRSYKCLFGMTPHQFLIEKRLQEAKKLLTTTRSLPGSRISKC